MPTQGTSFYSKEIFPENIIYISDTPQNRAAIKEILGDVDYFLGGAAYIMVDVETCEWSPRPLFEWLYRDAPPLHSIEEVKCKIKEKFRADKLDRLI
jgi:hypothetical protein